MKCEICGKEARLKRTLIEGVEMMACDECSKYGIVLPERKKIVQRKPKKIIPYSKDVFEEMKKELIPDWGKKIRDARERKKYDERRAWSKSWGKNNYNSKN